MSHVSVTEFGFCAGAEGCLGGFKRGLQVVFALQSSPWSLFGGEAEGGNLSEACFESDDKRDECLNLEPLGEGGKLFVTVWCVG